MDIKYDKILGRIREKDETSIPPGTYLKEVLMSPTSARVTPNGDDATGMVGRFDKPFRTPEAAEAAIPFDGHLFVEPGSYTVNWTIGFGKNIHLIGASISGTLSVGILSSVYGKSISYGSASSKFENCTITSISSFGFIRGVSFVNSVIQNIGDDVAILEIPRLTYVSDFITMSAGVTLNVSFSPLAIISGTGTFVKYAGSPGQLGLNVIIYGIPQKNSDSVTTIVDVAGALSPSVQLNSCYIGASSDAIVSGLGSSNFTLKLIDAKVRSGSYILNNSTSTGTATIELIGSSEIDPGAAEAINWSTNPANVVTLKAFPGTSSTKDWNTAGVINLATSTDYSTIDSTLTL